ARTRLRQSHSRPALQNLRRSRAGPTGGCNSFNCSDAQCANREAITGDYVGFSIHRQRVRPLARSVTVTNPWPNAARNANGRTKLPGRLNEILVLAAISLAALTQSHLQQPSAAEPDCPTTCAGSRSRRRAARALKFQRTSSPFPGYIGAGLRETCCVRRRS